MTEIRPDWCDPPPPRRPDYRDSPSLIGSEPAGITWRSVTVVVIGFVAGACLLPWIALAGLHFGEWFEAYCNWVYAL